MRYHPVIIDPRPAPPAPQAPPPSRPAWGGGVLLRSVNWLGDLLMTLPATWQLRQLLPEGVPLWAFSPAALAPVWSAAPWIDGVIPFAGRHPGREAIAEARAHGFGVSIVMPNSFGSALDIWKCRIPRRIGRAGNLRRLLLTDAVRTWPRGAGAPQCHQLSFYLELMTALEPAGNGTPIAFTAEGCPPLRVSPDFAGAHGLRRGKRWLALAPGAAFGPAKQWPPEAYAQVARRWLERGGRVVLTGSGKDAAASREVLQCEPRCLDLTGRTTMPELMSVLASSDAVLANDSGAMHLAAALGTPGVAVFLSTDTMATGPLGAPWEIIAADVPCRPCLRRECPLEAGGRYACRKAIDTQQVGDAVLRLFR